MNARIEMSDKDITRIVENHGYRLANGQYYGRTHICKSGNTGLCGARVDNTFQNRNTSICLVCRQIAVKTIVQDHIKLQKWMAK